MVWTKHKIIKFIAFTNIFWRVLNLRKVYAYNHYVYKAINLMIKRQYIVPYIIEFTLPWIVRKFDQINLNLYLSLNNSIYLSIHWIAVCKLISNSIYLSKIVQNHKNFDCSKLLNRAILEFNCFAQTSSASFTLLLKSSAISLMSSVFHRPNSGSFDN